jgi:hypothetical protein
LQLVRPLYSRQRHTLLRWSAMLCAASVLLSPLTVRPSFRAEAEGERAVAVRALPELPSRLEFPTIVITHDPFIPSSAAGLPLGEAVAGAASGIDVTAMPIVRAVIVGASPKALVDIGETPQVVGIGSALGGSFVTSISAGGIQLQNGQTFRFSEKQP